MKVAVLVMVTGVMTAMAVGIPGATHAPVNRTAIVAVEVIVTGVQTAKFVSTATVTVSAVNVTTAAK